MRSLAFVVASLVLAGCSGEQAVVEPEVTAEVAPEVAEPEPVEAPVMLTANGSPPGTYEVISADGSVAISVLNGDGTYILSTADGTLIAEGTWAVTDGKQCFSPTTEGAEAMCYTDTAPAADGSFTGTPDVGDPVTVRPVPAQ